MQIGGLGLETSFFEELGASGGEVGGCELEGFWVLFHG